MKTRLEQEQNAATPAILYLNERSVKSFLDGYRNNLTTGNHERKKAILRSVIDKGVFDGEMLILHPAYETLTGVKMASPRGGHLIPQLRATSQMIIIN